MWIEAAFVLLVAALMFVVAEKIRREKKDSSDPPDVLQINVEIQDEERKN